MIVSVLLILSCFFLFFYLIVRWCKRRGLQLTTTQIGVAFALRTLLGLAYGYIFLTYFGGDDTWYFHNGSLEEQEKLIKDPLQFFADLGPGKIFRLYPEFSVAWYYYLSDLEFFLLTKPMAIFNFISQGNYYVNSVLFNFIGFWGQIWLFRLFVSEFPAKRTPVFIAVFLIPGIVFWLSGIRGDGLLVFFLALVLVKFRDWIHDRRTWSIIGVLIGLAGIVILRSMLLPVLLPALIAWWIAVRKRLPLFKVVLIVYGSCLVVFFASALFSPNKNLPQVVVNRQASFMKLRAKSKFELDTLQPNFLSFAKVLPQAVNNTFLRPYAWEARGAFQWAAAAQTFLLIILLVLCFLKPDPNWKNYLLHPLVFCLLLFATALYVFIGYAIPFPGAIIRYKIPAEIFFFLTAFMLIDWRNRFKLK